MAVVWRVLCAKVIGATSSEGLSEYKLISFQVNTFSNFLPRDAMLAVCLCLSVSVTSRCSIETNERIGLVFGTGASLDVSYTAL